MVATGRGHDRRRGSPQGRRRRCRWQGRAEHMSPAVHNFRRAELEARIEELIALLDDVDGDADFEDSADAEPSVCSPAIMIAGRIENDLEFDTSDYEFGGDDVDYSAGKFEGGSGL